ncbi:MAG TPA: DNA repair protein RecO [Methylococcus sp.]|nr:DNA repair protein RecO [Methylococcus sp.]
MPSGPDPEHKRVLLDQALVLHRRNYRETSLLVELFTLAHGRMGVLAKGVKRDRRQAGGAWLQPFVPLLVSWTGRGDLPILTGAEALGAPLRLAQTSLFCALYVNELLLKLLPRQDPHPNLFVSYQNCLEQLAAGDDAESSLRHFELTLLEEVGYGLQLATEAESGRPIDPGRFYTYRVEMGPCLAADASDAIRGATLLALKERRFDDARMRVESKRLLRKVIHHHLGGRTLRTRDLFGSHS